MYKTFLLKYCRDSSFPYVKRKQVIHAFFYSLCYIREPCVCAYMCVSVCVRSL